MFGHLGFRGLGLIGVMVLHLGLYGLRFKFSMVLHLELMGFCYLGFGSELRFVFACLGMSPKP